MIGDLNSAFGVSEESDNGRRMIDFSAESKLWVENMHFKYKKLHKYI